MSLFICMLIIIANAATRTHARTHTHTHTHTHTLALEHKDCVRMFKSYNGLQYHLKRHRVPRDYLQCPICKRVLLGRKRFENHVRNKHPDHDVDLMVREMLQRIHIVYTFM